MGARDYDVCKEIASLDDGVLGADITEDRDILTMYAKPKVPLPNAERFVQVFVRLQVMVSIAKNNADFFRRMRYLVSSFDSSDVMFFPFVRRDGGGEDKEKDRILVIQTLRPCDHKRMVGEVAWRTR